MERTSAKKKIELLMMARRGDKRPNKEKHHLGSALCCYTRKGSKCYDLEFDREVRKIARHWFVDVAENKRELLVMAYRGNEKPQQRKHPLGTALFNYTNKIMFSYDLEFDKKIREIAPHWFISQFDKAIEKKKELLAMASRGEKRPSKKTRLGEALSSYTSRTQCFDEDFNKEIRRLAPHWFLHYKQKIM